MANATVSQLSFGGSGSSGNYAYSDADLQAVMAQSGAAGLQPVNVIVQAGFGSIPPPQEVTGMIAVDSRGQQLNATSNLVALPCPPYCSQ